eukprot:COSAG06_NODE_16695_length_986_cov_1.506201_1_plen_98_part_10
MAVRSDLHLDDAPERTVGVPCGNLRAWLSGLTLPCCCECWVQIEFFCGVGPITINYWPAVEAAVVQAKAEGLKATLVDMQACHNMTGQPLTNMSGGCQ